MTSLYELVPAYRQIMDEIDANPEEAEKWLDTLDSINCALEVKVDGYCKMMKMLSDTEGMEKEARRLADRAKAQKNLAGKLKDRLQYALEVMGRDKVKTDLFTVSVQNVRASVDVHTPELLPENFKRTTITVDYDKNAIYKAIQSGEVVPGACLMAKKGLAVR